MQAKRSERPIPGSERHPLDHAAYDGIAVVDQQGKGIPVDHQIPHGAVPFVLEKLMIVGERLQIIQQLRVAGGGHVDLIRQTQQRGKIGQADGCAVGRRQRRRIGVFVPQVCFPVPA